MASIPSSFASKKLDILRNLSTPSGEYSDLSPKGSVDIGIRDLIEEINGIDGLVTTSSCAGRVSVFLEGFRTESHEENGLVQSTSQTVVPGGKGNGGRWLYVTHDPIGGLSNGQLGGLPLAEVFGMLCGSTGLERVRPTSTRFAKFQFEPMILHIMAASLRHAQPVLAAAINAGFRESGVQSLKNIDDPNAFPMIAIRSSGLSLSSVIGFTDDNETDTDVVCIVSDGYLEILVMLANERFRANAVRVARFRSQLSQRRVKSGQSPSDTWEDKASRRERMRKCGLEKRKRLQAEEAQTDDQVKSQHCEDDQDSLLEGLKSDAD